jgi:Rieske Fe-S protein
MACSGEDESSSPQMVGDVDAGNVSALAVGALRIVPGAPVAIGRDDEGVYAMTTTCTHQGCDMSRSGSVSANGARCNCHGSTFDRNGSVTGGPANGPLAHFAVDIDQDGAITVHTDNIVSASDRTSPG